MTSQTAVHNKRPINVGVIGTGPRASSFFRYAADHETFAVQPTALFDPSAEKRDLFVGKYGGSAAIAICNSREELLAHRGLDALIVGAPNHLHAEIAIEAFERGIPMLLEKPVAITLEECQRLWITYKACGSPPTVVGFVLRHTPFFRRAMEMVESGQLGEILAIDSDEHVGASTTALFWHNWRRFKKSSGGFLVEKCCHDFDMLRCLTRANVKTIFSIARRTHLVPGGKLRHQRLEKALGALRERAGEDTAGRESIYDLSTDNPDHQSVLIEWDNGILTNFSACLGQVRNTRRLRVSGSAGTLEGDAEEGHLHVHKASDNDPSPSYEGHTITTDGSGHHGADRFIADSFWRMAAGEPIDKHAGIRDGIEAVIIGLAAQKSAESGLPVEVGPMRQQVFGDDC